MKTKNKGKVHPSPSSSSSSTAATTTTSTTTIATSSSDPIVSTLQFLPAAVLALAAVLPPLDKEVLSYLLAHSLNHTSSPSNRKSSSAAHISPSSHCNCFDCYTIYWLRWDSSPNRDLIHRVIDAFEDHLSSASSSSSSSSSNSSSTVPLVGKSKIGGGRGGGRRGKDKAVNHEKRDRTDSSSRGSGGNGGVPDVGDTGVGREKKEREENDEATIEDSLPGSAIPSPPLPGVGVGGGGGDHKGLARKVLPDVLGILNSRLWNLWSPNV